MILDSFRCEEGRRATEEHLADVDEQLTRDGTVRVENDYIIFVVGIVAYCKLKMLSESPPHSIDLRYNSLILLPIDPYHHHHQQDDNSTLVLPNSHYYQYQTIDVDR